MSAERIDVLAVKRAMGLEDCREGSRAVGHSGPENDEWEDYIEAPVAKLAAVVELIEAAKKAEAMIRGTDAEHLAVDAAARVGLGEYLRAAIARAQGEGA